MAQSRAEGSYAPYNYTGNGFSGWRINVTMTRHPFNPRLHFDLSGADVQSCLPSDPVLTDSDWKANVDEKSARLEVLRLIKAKSALY